nr:MAG TPA: hypothetical protein [Bacteriophage sp.]
MPHIQKLFLTTDSITSFLGGGIDGIPPIPVISSVYAFAQASTRNCPHQ